MTGLSLALVLLSAVAHASWNLLLKRGRNQEVFAWWLQIAIIVLLAPLAAVRDTADARKRAEQAAFDLEKVRLERLKEQLQYGVITAPQAGMIVYANSNSRRSTEVQIEERQRVLSERAASVWPA